MASFFFTLTQWYEKNREEMWVEEEKESRSHHWQVLWRWRLQIDQQPRKWPSELRQWQPETDEGGGWRTK